MFYLYGMKRSRLLYAILIVAIDIALLVAIVTSWLGGGTTVTHHSKPTSTHTKRTTRNGATPPSSTSNYRPLRVQPPQTAVERAVNQSLTSLSSTGWAQLSRKSFPLPATSATFPVIRGADTESATLYAIAFSQELLDVDFATSTRNELLAWANFNRAPYSLSVIPSSLSAKVFCSSLTVAPSPVPTAVKWTALARSKTMWRVSGLVVSVNPTWTQAISAGWLPVDPLMEIDDVSGLLTITTPGHSPTVESIAFALTLGGAALHPGYGVVAFDDWTVN